MSNMRIYDAFRNTPKDALRAITEGKLKGKSDINPMWRLQMLTERFGPIGFGWNYKVTRLERMEVPERSEIMCFVDIELKVKEGDTWSEPIYGTGGSMLVENFRSAGIKSNDDGYKMALTDAISIACKQLGMSADVYWAAGETKYSRETQRPESRADRINDMCIQHGISVEVFGDYLKTLQDDGKVARTTIKKMTDDQFLTAMDQVDKALQQTKEKPA